MVTKDAITEEHFGALVRTFYTVSGVQSRGSIDEAAITDGLRAVVQDLGVRFAQVEPEDTVIVKDKDGDVWEKDSNGEWYMTNRTLGGRTWDILTLDYGPLRIYRLEV